MSLQDTHNRWITKLVEQMSSIEGVTHLSLKHEQIELRILHNGAQRTVLMAGRTSDIRGQKDQYGKMRSALTELGIIEGQNFTPPKRSRKPMSPQMAAARAKQQQEFGAWQEIWRTIRKAETSLDREYEISNMIDYY
ncbi:MAG: hypothetical protein GKS01_11635 [Alphaproteobacteria bacterium]|nr:hypothetical protein [Alphaproteobacteria bacterium]